MTFSSYIGFKILALANINIFVFFFISSSFQTLLTSWYLVFIKSKLAANLSANQYIVSIKPHSSTFLFGMSTHFCSLSLNSLISSAVQQISYAENRMASHLQHRVGLQQAVFDGLHLLAGRTGDGVVLQDLLGCLRLPGAALPGDEDALVLSLGPQGTVRVVCHCVAGGAEGETWSGRWSAGCLTANNSSQTVIS